jgi:hypothetical protein
MHTFRKQSPVPIHLQFDIPTAGTSHLYFHFFCGRFSTSSFDSLRPRCILEELHDERQKNYITCIYGHDLVGNKLNITQITSKFFDKYHIEIQNYICKKKKKKKKKKHTFLNMNS